MKKHIIDLDPPASEPIWWTIEDSEGCSFYTKATLWFDARNNFGGDCCPVQVENQKLIASLNKALPSPTQKFRQTVELEEDPDGRVII